MFTEQDQGKFRSTKVLEKKFSWGPGVTEVVGSSPGSSQSTGPLHKLFPALGEGMLLLTLEAGEGSLNKLCSLCSGVSSGGRANGDGGQAAHKPRQKSVENFEAGGLKTLKFQG